MAQFLENVWTKSTLSSGSITSRKDGVRPSIVECGIVDEAAVDLVRDDPEAMPAGDVADAAQILVACGPAGGIGRRIDDEGAGARRDRLFEPLEIEMTSPSRRWSSARRRAARRNGDRAREIRPGRAWE